MRRLLVTALIALLAPTAPAAAAPYDVPEVVGGDELARIDRVTSVPILLPESIDLDFDGPAYAVTSARRRSWSVTLSAEPDCGANACLLATFDAERGGTLAFRRRVQITRTVRGSYKPLSCGASCSPPTLDFVRRGVRYSLQAKLGVGGSDAAQRAALVRAARSALAAGPRP